MGERGRPKGSTNKPKLANQEQILEVIKEEIRAMFSEMEIKINVEFIKKETRGRKPETERRKFVKKLNKKLAD